ncbi:MAG: hypothetical protein CMI53_01125 [Parcubacteria group bacterium]|nr:hypothetical protein [Parcubacteria group bacterium]|tara:strand:- start:15626 stop:17899 length:2274 start_codon:yes stop_codon:yes gene_type:complete
MNITWRKFFPILFLLAIAVLFFLPFFINQTIPYIGDFTGSDLTELNLPFRFLAAESLKQGEIPLWTNSLANGFPLLAEGQAGVFYPLNILLYTFLPFFLAVNVGLLINFFLGSVFTFLFSRSLKISRFGSTLAALAFSFSGFFIFRLKHLNYINAAIWLPLIFYLVEKYFSSKKKSLILIAIGAVFAIQFFAGSPPFTYISLVSAFIYFCLKVFFEGKDNFKLKKIFHKIILPWLLLAVMLFGLVAIQLLPTFFYSAISSRSQTMTYGDITSFPYPASSIINFVAPYFWGNPAFNTYPLEINIFGIFWENNIYFGLAPLALSLIAIFFLFARNKVVRFLFILLTISFLFAFGDFSPLFIIFWNVIPGFQMFRFPQRFLLLALVCFTVLAGFGFDFLWQKLQDWQKRSKRMLKSKLLFSTLLPSLIILIVAVDLFFVAFNYLGSMDYKKYFTPSDSAQFLKQDNDIFRIYSIDWPGAWHSLYQVSGGWQNNLDFFVSGKELIPPNLNVFWGINSVQDRASSEGGMLVRENHLLINRLVTASWSDQDSEGKITISDQALKVFGLGNVKYVLSYKDLKNENLELVKEIRRDFLPSLKIYENQYFLPFTFGIFDVVESSSTDQALGLLFEENFDPEHQTVIASGQPLLNDQTSESTAEVVIIKQTDNSFKLTANFSDPGYLYLSQAFFPGWQAYINDSEVEIVRANYAFTAIKIPAGQHEIKFLFKSMPYFIGKLLTLLTILILFLYLLYYFINQKKQVNQ